MYAHRGPTVWHGLPDLRDLSHHVSPWSNLPIPCWHVGRLFDVASRRVYEMIENNQVETVNVLGRRSIKLGSLPQTARCQYIEHLFRDRLSMDNTLHRARLLYDALDLNKDSLRRMFDQGMVEREYLPTGSPRYPHWGLAPGVQDVVIDYLAEQNQISKV